MKRAFHIFRRENRPSGVAGEYRTEGIMTSVIQTKDISSTLHLSLNVVKERYHVDKIALFGSRARGDAREDSDIDILVDFAPGADLEGLSGLKLYFEILIHNFMTSITNLEEVNTLIFQNKSPQPHLLSYLSGKD